MQAPGFEAEKAKQEREDASGIRPGLRYTPTVGIFYLAGTAIGVKLVR